MDIPFYFVKHSIRKEIEFSAANQLFKEDFFHPPQNVKPCILITFKNIDPRYLFFSSTKSV